MTDYRSDRCARALTHSEGATFSPLTIVDLKSEAAKVEQSCKNFVVSM